MNELMFRGPLANMFREIEALMDFDFNKESRGLRRLISRPHNLLTKKDENGIVTGYQLQVPYTPFKKSDVQVKVIDNCLSVRCGSENIQRDEDMDYCGISNQSYEFRLPLSESVDAKAISAKADDGMLCITLPVKKEEEKIEEEAQIIDIQ